MDAKFLEEVVTFVRNKGGILRYSEDSSITGWGASLSEISSEGKLPLSEAQRHVVESGIRAVERGLPHAETVAWAALEWASGYLPSGEAITEENLRAAMPEGNFRDIRHHLWVLNT